MARQLPQQRRTDEGLRKAAVLVASLDTASADAMLDQLPAEQAQRVRNAVIELGDVDPKEQRCVIDEFFRVGPMVPRQLPPGIELDDRAGVRLSPALARGSMGDAAVAHAPSHGAPPFQSLGQSESDKLSRVLESERPQTIALVLAHLPPDRAAGVLARLPAALQAEVVHRLATLEETDPEILREVERGLESRLSQQVSMQRRRIAGTEAIAGILQSADRQTVAKILDNLAALDPLLAERFGPPRLAFDDLLRLDDAALLAVFRAAPPEVAMTALVGALPELVDRVLRRFPASEAQQVRRRLDHPGPLRLSDVESARQELADVARRLGMEGRIRLPENQPLAVA